MYACILYIIASTIRIMINTCNVKQKYSLLLSHDVNITVSIQALYNANCSIQGLNSLIGGAEWGVGSSPGGGGGGGVLTYILLLKDLSI